MVLLRCIDKVDLKRERMNQIRNEAHFSLKMICARSNLSLSGKSILIHFYQYMCLCTNYRCKITTILCYSSYTSRTNMKGCELKPGVLCSILIVLMNYHPKAYYCTTVINANAYICCGSCMFRSTCYSLLLGHDDLPTCIEPYLDTETRLSVYGTVNGFRWNAYINE